MDGVEGRATPADDESDTRGMYEKELLCRGKPSYLDRAEAYTQREVFVALLTPG